MCLSMKLRWRDVLDNTLLLPPPPPQQCCCFVGLVSLILAVSTTFPLIQQITESAARVAGPSACYPTVTCSWCQKEVLHYPCLWSLYLSTLLHQDRCSWNHPGKQIRELTEWTTLIRWTKPGEQRSLLVWSTLSCDSQGHNIAGTGKRQSSQKQNVSSGKSAGLGQSKM